MTYDRKLQEKLKQLIYTNKFEEFKNEFDTIKKTASSVSQRASKEEDNKEESYTIRDYLEGKNDEGRGLLGWASSQISTGEKFIEYLINQGADINHQDGKGRTALHLALDHGHLNNTIKLLRKGADINLADRNGDLPLHIASHTQDNNAELIELLCESGGAKIDVKNKQGATPLHIAAKYSLNAIHALVKYYPNDIKKIINLADDHGDTPLHYAAMSETGYNNTYLLILGADRTLTNKANETAAQVANDWDANGEDWKAIIGFSLNENHDPEVFYNETLEKGMQLLGQDS